MDLSIIFVNWNSLHYLRDCISSILEWTKDLAFEVIVVDNASPEGGVESLRLPFPDVKVIKSEKNLGFAGANNLGFKHSAGENILFLNPDTKLFSPAISIMKQELESLPTPGIVGCRLLNTDLSVQTSSIMKFPKIWNTILQIEFLRLRWPKLWGIGPLFSTDSKPVVVEAVSGACMMLKRDTFERLGMFDEDYFMYSEDVDLCYRAVRAGFNNYYAGRASIVHYGGKSSAAERQNVMKTMAEMRFCRKNYGLAYALIFQTMMVINASVRLILLGTYRFLLTAARRNGRLDIAWAKWRTILKTLVAYTGHAEGQGLPRTIPNCAPPNL